MNAEQVLNEIQAEIDRGKTKDCLGCLNGKDLEYDPLTNTMNGFCRACWRIWEGGRMYLLWDWQATENRIAASRIEPQEKK